MKAPLATPTDVRGRGDRVVRLASMLRTAKRDMTRAEHELLDTVDCDLELCCVRLERIADRVCK